MIDYITGTVKYIHTDHVVLECGHIGYKINCPNPFVYQDEIGNTKTIYMYQHVREDILALYGFENLDERDLFMKLIQVSGIGPKGALAILASGKPAQVVTAIENEDEKFLTRFPGVGKKTARQMILDLKGKLPNWTDTLFDEKPETSVSPQGLDDALEALVALGYGQKEIKKIVPQLEEQERLSTDQYIKKALQLLLN
ncbi:Holliday junction branch migration protein RuvA [Pseudalkalibacillus berkeleyi]|uniref:Holliday junction branch migration complex subunit RuvA n=1 Tax=Pseudalkalibacillus berkeleyi TaxID=1069813 RepID=A0ABS9H2J5_9BACL|nr:Holliday junction branch migration protein RuvA [Pseudalkalibacillus berkeleyi]MCF6138078.1 Holliday junction branch migration protein RuvA [Pseudalkalibacillus berkeleyi]